MDDQHDSSVTLVSFAHNLRFEQLPASVVLRTKMALLDTLAAAFAGERSETVAKLSPLVGSWGGRPEATEFGSGRKLPVAAAALLNGVAARVLDLDDVHEQNTCHVSASVVACALAVVESRPGINGAMLLTAIAAGTELCCRVSAAPRISFTQTGQSLSYQCAFLSSALAASMLLGLSQEQTLDALGIAYARIAGNQQGFLSGADTVSLMQGLAAQGGVEAAFMAQQGLSGARDIFEGRFGYFNAYHRGLFDAQELTAGLGEKWKMQETSIKPLYPFCKFVHGPVEALLLAMADAGAAAADLDEIRVEVTNNEVFDIVCSPAAVKWAPVSLRDAQFSLPFLIAWAATYGKVDLTLLAPESCRDARVLELAQRVRVDLRVEPGAARGRFPMPGVVQIRTRTGLKVGRTVEYVRGHPSNPMQWPELEAKLRAGAEFGRPGWTGSDALCKLILNLEREADLTRLANLCNASGSRSSSVGLDGRKDTEREQHAGR
jgi:2-methylcitrate dehydratase PrpD